MLWACTRLVGARDRCRQHKVVFTTLNAMSSTSYILAQSRVTHKSVVNLKGLALPSCKKISEKNPKLGIFARDYPSKTDEFMVSVER